MISVSQADLVFISGSLFNHDTAAFRAELKSWEDSEEGMVQPKTHNHNAAVLLGGIQYARVIEILSPYTITFEETGTPYVVSLSGSNNNILEKTNLGTVQILSNNSAGLINVSEVQFDAFQSMVTIDVDNGVSGTVYPAGTAVRPVNNLADALLIAAYRGFNMLHLNSALTIATGQNVDGYTLHSGEWQEVTVEAGVSLVDTNFERISLYGVMGGFWNVLIDCWVYDITNFCGWVRGGSIESVALAAYTVESAGRSYFDDIVPMYPGISSTLTMNTDTAVSFTNSTDITTILSMTAGSTIECGLHGGEVIVDVSCTGGSVTVVGVGVCTNNSALVPDVVGLVNKETVADAAWDDVSADHLTAGTTGKALSDAGSAGNPWGSPIAGNTDAGTFGELVGKKLLTVAKFLGLK